MGSTAEGVAQARGSEPVVGPIQRHLELVEPGPEVAVGVEEHPTEEQLVHVRTQAGKLEDECREEREQRR